MKRYISSEDLKQIQLEMLKDVTTFCDNHNIKYFLAYGSLLGAIRHKGYIPWDDDVDICLPRPDYEKFVKEYKNDTFNYQIKEFRKTSGYGLPFAKVSNDNTVINEYMYKQDTFGVYIDVFPLDGFGNRWQIVESKWLRRFLNTKKAILGRGRTFVKNLIICIGKVILLPFSVQGILNIMHNVATRYNYFNCKYTEIFCSSTVEREIVPIDFFSNFTSADFEDIKVNVPIRCNEYLTFLYGDYMTLPPIEKRESTHKFVAWWKD